MLSEILPPGFAATPPQGDTSQQVTPMSNDLTAEAEEVALRVRRKGYCLLYLPLVDDFVAFARDDAVDRVPPGYVVYTQSELEELYGKPQSIVISTFRLVHEAKKLGGRVVRRRNGSLQAWRPDEAGSS
jgi:hypothetical protein